MEGNGLLVGRGLLRLKHLRNGTPHLRFGDGTFLRLGTQGHIHIADFDFHAVLFGHGLFYLLGNPYQAVLSLGWVEKILSLQSALWKAGRHG